MKKNDYFILLATTAFTLLFYHQLIGVNLFIYTIILVLLLLLRDNSLVKNKVFLLSASLSILTAFAAYLHSSNFSIMMNIISLILTAAISIHPENSIIANFFHGIYSQISVFAYMLYDIFKKQNQLDDNLQKDNHWAKKVILSIIPVLIFFIFFFLYRESNVVFKNISDQINLDFISVEWIGFTILGLLLTYPFFLQHAIDIIKKKDNELNENLSNTHIQSDNDHESTFMSLKNESITAILLFALLIILTLSVNITDIMYTWSSTILPNGLTYSEYIHSGISSLITSIILAIVIILLFFRGALNFYSNNKFLKALAYIWIIQNVFLVLSTLMRNKMYVDTYSLTEKRVGVFIYLGLCIIGLLLCLYKIAFQKKNIFLFRKNMWAIYISLCMLSILDWNYYIAAYNVYRAKKSNDFYLDANYMGELNENNFPVVWNYYQSLPDTDFRKAVLKKIVDTKMSTILLKYNQHDFRSLTYKRQASYRMISKLDQQQAIQSLNASSLRINDLSFLMPLQHLIEINLSNNELKDISKLSQLPSLQIVDLSVNMLDSIHKWPELPHLKELNLSNTKISNLHKITPYTQITSLNISNNSIYTIDEITDFKQLENLDISNNPLSSITVLSILQHLKSLKISGVLSPSIKLPTLASLEKLDVSNSTKLTTQTDTITVFSEKLINQLKELNISNTQLQNLNILSNLSSTNHLQKLNLSSNNLNALINLSLANELKELNLNNNNLGASTCWLPTSIEYLYVSNTNSSDYTFIEPLQQLKELDLSSNRIQFNDTFQLPKLEVLDVSNCQYLLDLKKMQLPHLKKLVIKQCEINDFTFIKQLHSLESIEISAINPTLGAILLELPSLKKVECYSIDEKIYNALISKNQNIYIIRNDQSRFLDSSISSSY
ncbi:MAG: DUF4153 domain-containing protein [Bacteroidota bacterium]